jgi:hypothetical protein
MKLTIEKEEFGHPDVSASQDASDTLEGGPTQRQTGLDGMVSSAAI